MSDATLELVGTQFECSAVVKSSEAQAIDAEQFHIASSHLVDREVVAAPLQEPYAEELSGERTRGAARGSRMRLSGMRGSFAQTSQGNQAGLASVVRLKRWMNKAQADMQAGDDGPSERTRSPSPPHDGLHRERHDSTNFFVHDVGHDAQRMGKPHGNLLGKPLPHAHAHGQDPNHLHPKPALPFIDAINARRRRTSHNDHGRGSSSRPRPSASDAPDGSGKACAACRQDVVAGPFNSVTDGAVGSPAFHIDVPTSLDRKAPHRASQGRGSSAAHSASHGRGSSAAQRTSWAGSRPEVAGAGAGAGTGAGAATAETLSTSTSSAVAEEQVAAAEHDVRMLMPAAVVSSLRRSAIILSGLSVAFAFYEWVEWKVCRVLVPNHGATAWQDQPPSLLYGRTTRWWRSTTSRSCACCCCGWRLRCPSPPSSPSQSRSSRSAASS